MSGIPLIDEKCTGAFVASAIGDALGWPNEFRASNINKKTKPVSNFVEWTRSSGGRYWSHNEKILAGEYSDDTQMNLAVARSILSGKPWAGHLADVELPFWLEYERGGGGALKRAAKLWKKKTEPWKGTSSDIDLYFNAGGNGAAMRVLPHVISGVKKEFVVIANDIARDASLTHGHPRAIVGAMCYSYALWYLFKKTDTLSFGELANAVISAQNEWNKIPDILNGEWLETAKSSQDYTHVWIATVDNVVSQLKLITAALEKGALDSENETLETLGCFNKNVNGAGDIAAIAAIYYASKYANNPVLGIKSAANAIGADTDTIASMVGGLLGALMGLSWIPTEWKTVQDYECLIQITELLLSENRKEASKAFVSKVKKQIGGWESTPIGLMRSLDIFTVKSGKSVRVIITKRQSSLGQTMYFKEYKRNETDPHQLEVQTQRQFTLQDLAAQHQSNIDNLSPRQTEKNVLNNKNIDFHDYRRQFTLDAERITALLGDPQFKKNITIGKVLQVIQVLITDNKAIESIAKRYEIEPTMVALINKYVDSCFLNDASKMTK